MVNALGLNKIKLITLRHVCDQFILGKIKVFSLLLAIFRNCRLSSLQVGLSSLMENLDQ